jgi:nitroreductase
MEIIELIRKTRSYRRFDETYKVSKSELMQLIDCARLGASARNQQSLKYIIVNDPNVNASVFPLLNWAGYLTDWDGPAIGERPTGYIIVLNDTAIAKNHFCDEGIAMQNIMLCAASIKLGSCIIASFNKSKVKELLAIDDNIEVLNVVAIGKPNEDIQLTEMRRGDYKYWRDAKSVHYVPKRKLEEVIYKEL